MAFIFVSIILSLFFFVGIFLIHRSIEDVRRTKKAKTWPTTRARLTACELDVDEGDADEARSYKVGVHYIYSVQGEAYESNQVAFGYGKSSGECRHKALYERLKNADILLIRYNPDDPSEAILTLSQRSCYNSMAYAVACISMALCFGLVFYLSESQDRAMLKGIEVIANKPLEETR